MFHRLFGRNVSPIKAVYEQDLLHYLDSLGVLKHIEEGKIRCIHCNQVITVENLDAIVPKKGEVQFVCWNKDCAGQDI